MKIEDSSSVVTGASSGIGRAIAIELASRGASLVLAARSGEKLRETAEACREHGSRVFVTPTDVTSEQECAQLISQSVGQLGKVDLLICAAGFGNLGPALQTSPEQIEKMLDTNFLGAVRCSQAALPHMLERRRGGLVFISSIVGIMGTEGMAGYSASKFALNGWAEALRDEILDDGLFVTLVCPATTETPFFERADRSRIPAASRLLPTLTPEQVASATADAIESESWRIILPTRARLFMRLREIAPRTAHFLMRRTSRLLARRRD